MNVIPLPIRAPALRECTCGLHPHLSDAPEPASALLGGLLSCLKNIRGHPLLENIFHAQLHTIFCRRMREDIELFLADGIEDHLRYLGGWESHLCQPLARSLEQSLHLRTRGLLLGRIL